MFILGEWIIVPDSVLVSKYQNSAGELQAVGIILEWSPVSPVDPPPSSSAPACTSLEAVLTSTTPRLCSLARFSTVLQIRYEDKGTLNFLFRNCNSFKKMQVQFLGFTWRHKFHWRSTPNRYTVIGGKQFFTVCVELVFGSKYVQFREICLLQCSKIINTFWVDPHSELLKKVPVKPKNISFASTIWTTRKRLKSYMEFFASCNDKTEFDKAIRTTSNFSTKDSKRSICLSGFR